MRRKSNAFLKVTVLAIFSFLTWYCIAQLPILHWGWEKGITCKINGKPWVSKADASKENIRLVLYQDKSLHLYAKGVANDQGNRVTSTISFLITSVDAPGMYPLGSNRKNSGEYANFETLPYSFYFTDQSSTGFVHVTQLDTISRSIAGTFEYQASAMGHSFHAVQIKDGKFNMSY